MNKKGITPVIAVVLLLMMTVAAAGAAFFWITTIQSRIQGQIGTQTTESSAQNRQFQIISSECSNDIPNLINVTIQNVGSMQIDAGTTAITITDNQGKVITTNISTMPSVLQKGEIVTIDFITLNLTQNRTWGLKITLPGGAEQTSVCISK
jgi:flagellin-like protein